MSSETDMRQDPPEPSDGKREGKPRERSKVDRFQPSGPKVISELHIPKGSGSSLREITNVRVMLGRYGSDDPAMVSLHKVMFGRDGKHTLRKRNIREFSGAAEGCTVKMLEDRLNRIKSVSVLKEIAQILLCAPEKPDRSSLISAVAKFLEKPAATDQALPPSKGEIREKKREQRQKKAEAKSRRRSKEKRSKKGKEKEKDQPKRAITAFMYFSIERRPEIVKKHPEMPFGEVAQKISREWGRMDENDKKEYNGKAAKDRERYEREMKDWKTKSKGSKKTSKDQKKKGRASKKEKVDSDSQSSESESEDEKENSSSDEASSSSQSSAEQKKRKEKSGKHKKRQNKDKKRSSSKKKTDKKSAGKKASDKESSSEAGSSSSQSSEDAKKAKTTRKSKGDKDKQKRSPKKTIKDDGKKERSPQKSVPEGDKDEKGSEAGQKGDDARKTE
eukprot:RCo045215